MKQLDVVMSPPGFFWNPYMTLIHVTFDIEVKIKKSNGSRDMNFYIMNYFLVTDGQTDREKAMYKSPPVLMLIK